MSCLFDSVSKFTTNCSSSRLRSMVSDYLRSDPLYWDDLKFSDVFQMYSPDDVHFCTNINDYVVKMGLQSTWGGAIEIQAICNLFNISVRVHVLRNRGNVITFLPTAPQTCEPKHCIDISWNGFHFEPCCSSNPSIITS